MEKEIGEVLTALSNAFEAEDNVKNADWIKQVKEEYGHLDLKKPEMFGLLVSLDLKGKSRTLIKAVLKDVIMTKETKHRIEFAYLNYDFVTRHLKSILLEHEGYGCSTDKTRWIIDTYVEYLLHGTIPEITEYKYWHPKKGSVEDWMDYIDSIVSLYYGEANNYIVCKEKIIECYVRKEDE